MKTNVDFRADNDGNIVEITTITYTPQEWLQKAGEVYRFAQDMQPGRAKRSIEFIATEAIRQQIESQVKDKKAENGIDI